METEPATVAAASGVNSEMKIKIWFRVDEVGRRPDSVIVSQNVDVLDTLKAALCEVKLDQTNSDKVMVMFNGVELERDASINQFTTSARNPLLLVLPEETGEPKRKKRREMYEHFPTSSRCSQQTPAQRELVCDHITRSCLSGIVGGIHGTHVGLMWEPFAKFIDEVNDKSSIPETEHLMVAASLIREMSKDFDCERDRVFALQSCLETIGKFAPFNCGKAKSDLALLVNNTTPVPVVNIRVKNHLGATNNCPVEQNLVYYVHQTCDTNDLDPMLLVSLCGPHYLQVFGAVHGVNDEVLQDPLHQPVSLLEVPDDPLDTVVSVARVLKAMKTMIDRDFARTRTRTIDRSPYYNSQELRYTGNINSRVWNAVFTDNGNEKHVIVKFARAYSEEVHKFFSDRGMAPKLMKVDNLAGGWKAIVMEKIYGQTLHDLKYKLSDETKSKIEGKLRNVVEDMKQKRYVHGDIRLPNIMIAGSESDPFPTDPTPIVLDFEWAGTEGSAKYPAGLNPVIFSPVQASAFSNITCDIDAKMLVRLWQ